MVIKGDDSKFKIESDGDEEKGYVKDAKGNYYVRD